MKASPTMSRRSRRRPAADSRSQGSGGPPPSIHGTGSAWPAALLGAVLLYAAQPPLAWHWAAWIAPLPWLWLIAAERLPGRRPYLILYAAGALHWLAMLQGVRLAHWATYFGWLALACYLAAYAPLFVVLARAAVHRLRLPLLVAAPAVWVGLELVRGYFVTGFSSALLGHSQVRQLLWIQLADFGGAYAVSLLVMLVAACLAELPWPPAWLARLGLPATLFAAPRRAPLRPLLVAAAALLLAGGYGQGRLQHEQRLAEAAAGQAPPLRVALIQESIDTVFEYDPERNADAYRRYVERSRRALAADPSIALVVWPESALTANQPLISFAADATPPPDSQWPPDAFRLRLADIAADADAHLRRTSAQLSGRPLIGGAEANHYAGGHWRRFNAAAYVGPEGEILGQYHKMHPVMFGEYVPLGDVLPWLYRLTPMDGGLTPGERPEAFAVGRVKLSPSICFESTVPHLIRRQVATLAAAEQTPDVLVNLTNDGWFWGSSILDLHLACGVFRAVENRRPLLIAANTGLSAVIDPTGRIVAEAPRRTGATLLADVHQRGGLSPYTQWGDWLAGACLVLTAVAAAALVAGVWSERRAARSAPAE